MLAENSNGNYSFIHGIGPFSAAVLAQAGFEIVHARFFPPIALNDGYERLIRHLREIQRPLAALCGMELRIPKALSREGFEEFNRPYVEQLKGWGLEVAGANPVTRTNVAFETNAVKEPMLAGFYYTVPAPMPARLSYSQVQPKLRRAKAAFRSWHGVILRSTGSVRNSNASCRYSAAIFPK
jgi:hypothetical protein